MTRRLAWLILLDLLKNWVTWTLPLSVCAGLVGGWLAVYFLDIRPDPTNLLIGSVVVVVPSILGLCVGYGLFLWRAWERTKVR